eukprot:3940550-Rhodomonas_salina.5
MGSCTAKSNVADPFSGTNRSEKDLIWDATRCALKCLRSLRAVENTVQYHLSTGHYLLPAGRHFSTRHRLRIVCCVRTENRLGHYLSVLSIA